MSIHSAGILLFRYRENVLEVMLVHPGGPFWASRDEGAWSIPKGVFEPDERPLDAARREFREETGFNVDGDFIDLGRIRQRAGKVVHTWALQADLDPGGIQSNTFTMEWPRNSGRSREYPEVDRAAWFRLDEARKKMLKGQVPLLDALKAELAAGATRQPTECD